MCILNVHLVDSLQMILFLTIGIKAMVSIRYTSALVFDAFGFASIKNADGSWSKVVSIAHNWSNSCTHDTLGFVKGLTCKGDLGQK
jgi:hypothetical protein